ncbi:MAG TPA: hypothetical protein DCW68_02160 [Rhodospirillaceae bacterium]|nr:MAG: hypothetical protein A2018_05125 [Alphaproteobacteria bacterium GWF2_58_20]HAU28899.1 hypothetical protein [Rhodospirillaceae bacterium]
MSEMFKKPLQQQFVQEEENWPVDDVMLAAPSDVQDEVDDRMHEAAARNDVLELEKLLAEGADINGRSSVVGNTPLHVAAVERKSKAIDFLLAHGADTSLRNTLGMTAAEYAKNEGLALAKAKTVAGNNKLSHYRPVPARKSLLYRFLIGFGEFDDNVAAKTGTLFRNGVTVVAAVAAMLLIADGLIPLAVMLAGLGGMPQVVAALYRRHMKKYGDEEKLVEAVQDNDPRMVQFYLKKGVNPNGCGSGFPLVEAAEVLERAKVNDKHDKAEKAREIISLLVEYKADPNVRDDIGNTMLMALSSDSANLKTINTLLLHGADPNLRGEYGISPLELAVSRKNKGIVDALLEAGANPNSEKPGQVTALHLAVRSNDKYMVETLLEHGANLNAQNEKGYTPLFQAVLDDKRALVDRLMEDPRTDISIRNKEGKTVQEFLPLVYTEEEMKQALSGVFTRHAQDAGGKKPQESAPAPTRHLGPGI